MKHFLFITLLLTLFACNNAIHTRCCEIGSQSFSQDSIRIFVPTIFTPNKDGMNDVFTYSVYPATAFDKHRLIISKGSIVAFDKQDANVIEWDGLIDGSEAKENVLNYKLLVRKAGITTADSIVELKGTICLRKKAPICMDEIEGCVFPNQIDPRDGVVHLTQEPLVENCK